MVEPANNATARKTAGLASVVTTNVKNNADTTLDKDDVLDVMQMCYDNGGLMEGETRVLMVGSTQKRAISEAFVNATDGYRWQDSNVGGVNCQSMETDFGKLNVMLNRHVPSGRGVCPLPSRIWMFASRSTRQGSLLRGAAVQDWCC